MRYYSFKRKETLPHATTQMDLEGQILDNPNSGEVSKAVKLTEAESRMAAARGWGDGGRGGEWERLFNGYKVMQKF